MDEAVTDENSEDKTQFLKLVKDITSKGFVRNDYKKKLVDLSDIRINLKEKNNYFFLFEILSSFN